MPVSADYLVRLFGLEGDVAFITGGGGAIGAATALAYARAGAAVVLADKVPDAAGRVADQVKAIGGRALAVGMDVTQESSVQTAVERTVRELGKVLAGLLGGHAPSATASAMIVATKGGHHETGGQGCAHHRRRERHGSERGDALRTGGGQGRRR